MSLEDQKQYIDDAYVIKDYIQKKELEAQKQLQEQQPQQQPQQQNQPTN
jgi:hypothetical protein